MVDGGESSDGEHAARAVRAIELIQLGENQQAVQMLSHPIAYYYHLYAINGGTATRRQMRDMIERLSISNQVVAAVMTNMASDFEFHGKSQWKPKE